MRTYPIYQDYYQQCQLRRTLENIRVLRSQHRSQRPSFKEQVRT